METHEIRYFLAAARELNFTRAAASCNVSQPALTRAVKKLEAELGGALFLRRAGRVELTRLGRSVMPQLELIEQTMGNVRNQAQNLADQQASSLRIGLMCTIGPLHFADILGKLKQSVPDIEVTMAEAKASAVIELLVSDAIDVGITAWPQYPDTVIVQELYTERYAVAMPADHPFAALPAIPLARLVEHPYLERLNCEFIDLYVAEFGKWTLELDIWYSSEREDWIQALILAGQGLAIVPEFLTLEDGIVTRPLTQPDMKRKVALASLRGRQLVDAAQQFQRVVKAHKWSVPRRPRR